MRMLNWKDGISRGAGMLTFCEEWKSCMLEVIQVKIRRSRWEQP
jgi:hypothetical protein